MTEMIKLKCVCGGRGTQLGEEFGTGKTVNVKCTFCGGTGYYEVEKA